MPRGPHARQPFAGRREEVLLEHESGGAVEDGRLAHRPVRPRHRGADFDSSVGQGHGTFVLVLGPEGDQTEQFGHPVGAERDQLAGGRFGVVVMAAVERHGGFVAADPQPEQLVIAADIELPARDRRLGTEPEAPRRLAGHLRREPRDSGDRENRLGGHQAADAARVVVDRADHLLEGRLLRQGPRQRHDPDLIPAEGVRAGRAGGGERDDNEGQQAAPRSGPPQRRGRLSTGGAHAASPDQRSAASLASTAAAVAGSGGATFTRYSQSRFRHASRSGSDSVGEGPSEVADAWVG